MDADRVPGYLGRVLTEDGRSAGTCFQVAPGLLVTACHVLVQLGAAAVDAELLVDGLGNGSARSVARVVRTDAVHDLAVLRTERPFGASVAGFAASDALAPATEVQVVGASQVDDPDHEYRYTPATGTWIGPALRDEQVPLGVMASPFIARGMSGGPVRRLVDDAVVGVVSGRYNSGDGWLRDTVWLARVEDLSVLLDGIALVPVAQPGELVGVQCPYPGLASFDMEFARWYYGRDELIAELVGLLDRRTRTGGIQVVVAPSGAGKSSLLRAGLVRKLAEGALPGSERWPVRVFTPFGQLMKALPAQMGTASGRVVLVIDQFEELFTQCGDEDERRAFIEALGRLGPDAMVVIGLRVDFYGACATYPVLREAMQDAPLVVGPMTETELRQAIMCPAEDAGIGIGPGFVEVLLRDLGSTTSESGERGYPAERLPMLAHALRATWQKQPGAPLTVANYEATGGIDRAIARTADRTFAQLDPAAQRAAPLLFQRLVNIRDTAEGTRRRRTITELISVSPTAAAVLHAFTAARLLTVGSGTVEITHDALLHSWPQLRRWLDIDRAGQLVQQDLEDDANDWIRNDRHRSLLYRDIRLQAATTWAATTSQQLSPAAQAFLAASTSQHRRTVRKRTTTIIALATLSIIAVIGTVLAVGNARDANRAQTEAENQHKLALSRQLAAQSQTVNTTDPVVARRLAAAAWRTANTDEAYDAMIGLHRQQRDTLIGHTGRVYAVAFSPDGRRVASASADGTVRLWDPASGHPIGAPLPGGVPEVTHLAFSRDGKRLATAGDRFGSVTRLWDPASGKPAGPDIRATGPIAFSPDGTLFATADDAKSVHAWDPATGRDTGVLGTGPVTAMALSPDGTILATGTTERTLHLTDARTGQPLSPPLTGHTARISAIGFSPNGRLLASTAGAGLDRTVRLWDSASGQPVGAPLTGHTREITGVAFSPDSKLLATTSVDHTVRLWDPATGVALRSWEVTIGPSLAFGNTNVRTGVAFSPDGTMLATAAVDTSVRLWDPATGQPADNAISGHGDRVSRVAFSPDGKLLASAGVDHTVRLWDRATSRPVRDPLPGHSNEVWDLAFSPDGTLLATAAASGPVQLRDPATSKPAAASITGVRPLAFSPAGTLATGSADGSVRLWNPATGQQVGVLSTGRVHAMAFSPDGKLLAIIPAADIVIGGETNVQLWDVTTGHVSQVLPTGAGMLAFSPDGKLLAVTTAFTVHTPAADQSARIWDVASGSPVSAPLTGHKHGINQLAFSPDGSILATAGADQTVRLWDPATGHAKGSPLTGHTREVAGLAFSPDGKLLATASYDRTIRLWDTTIYSDPLSVLCSRYGGLTQDEWAQYASGEPFHDTCR